MGTITILPETTKDPISLMGRRAGVCWGGDITDAEKNYKRGLDCITSNHGRVLEFVNVEMVLDGYSARVIREWYTHIGGAPTRLQASTRYIKYDDFDYIVPPKIQGDPVQHGRFLYTMQSISKMLQMMEKDGVPREDLATMLPLAMTTKVVDKRNLRNLIDMSRQRMCNRAYWEFRELFKDICTALSEYSPEWKTIIDTQMMPKCEYLGYCPEKKSCGRKIQNAKCDVHTVEKIAYVPDPTPNVDLLIDSLLERMQQHSPKSIESLHPSPIPDIEFQCKQEGVNG